MKTFGRRNIGLEISPRADDYKKAGSRNFFEYWNDQVTSMLMIAYMTEPSRRLRLTTSAMHHSIEACECPFHGSGILYFQWANKSRILERVFPIIWHFQSLDKFAAD